MTQAEIEELAEFLKGCADRISLETEWHKAMRARYLEAATALLSLSQDNERMRGELRDHAILARAALSPQPEKGTE